MRDTEMRTNPELPTVRVTEESIGAAATFAAAPDREEAYVMMSLALDGLLDDVERARLEEMMEQDAEVRTTWQQWQKMNDLFSVVEHAEPEPGFALRFGARLDAREHRQRARQRWIVGSIAVVTWLAALAGLVVVGWMVVSSQTQWMNDLVRELVYYPSAAGIWVRALRSSLSATIGAPQSMAMVLGFAAAAAVMISTWLWLLRRTTHEEVVS